jgi:hypothetical protein
MYKTRSKLVPVVGRRSIRDVSSSTSNFTENDVSFLNISYRDVSSLFTTLPKEKYLRKYEYLLLRNMAYFDLVNMKEIGEDEATRKMLSAVDYMTSVLEITDETVTNDFVSFLLSELQLNLRPFRLRHERKYVIRFSETEITSVPDMSVEDGHTILLIDEDKSLSNVDHTSHWGENQIAGEIFTALYRNYSNNPEDYGEDHPVYAIRVIGTFFTFYKAVAKKEYLGSASRQELEEEFDEFGRQHIYLSEKLIIERYPSNTIKHLTQVRTSRRNYVGLNYWDIEDRKQIVFLLLSLKTTLENMEAT